VVLGPVVWPWYETWGFVFLAVIAEAWTLRLLLALSAVACFADLPSIRFFETTNPPLAIVCWTLLVGMTIAYVLLRLAPSAFNFPSTYDEPPRIATMSDRAHAEQIPADIATKR
jgi:hypothetical protein